MRYVEAPQELSGEDVGPLLFLAGGITYCPNWQQEAWQLLENRLVKDVPLGLELLTDELVVLNPRRKNFDESETAARQQIDWEFRHLSDAELTLFWFAAWPGNEVTPVQPIALYELGFAAANLVRDFVVGVDPNYPRRFDVIEQLGHARPEVPVLSTLEDTVDQAVEVLSQY